MSDSNPITHPGARIRLPDDKELREIARGLQLGKAGVHEIRLAICHAQETEAFILNVLEARPDRETLVQHLKKLEKSLRTLILVLEQSAELAAFLMPHEALSAIGKALTFSYMGEALGVPVFPRNEAAQSAGLHNGETPPTVEAVETHFLPWREALGLKHGHLALLHLLRDIHAPLQRSIEALRLNKGGRTADLARDILIYELARAAPEIIGKRAPVAKEGPFVKLCADVAAYCDLPEEGIEAAIPRVVGRFNKDWPK